MDADARSRRGRVDLGSADLRNGGFQSSQGASGPIRMSALESDIAAVDASVSHASRIAGEHYSQSGALLRRQHHGPGLASL